MATSEATIGQEPDQYGQYHPIETPELIARKRVEFEEELNKLPEKDTRALQDANAKCPELLTDEFKLMFLRCEVFNSNDAAKRYAYYWEKRVEIFGPERAFQPFTLDKAFKDDSVALHMGYCQFVPGAKDNTGRSMVLINPAKQDKTKYERISMVRALWYATHAALENKETQKQGILVLVYGNDAKLSQFDRELGKMNLNSLQGAIPGRVAGIHMCQPPSFFRLIYPIMQMFMKPRVKKRVKMHSGTSGQVSEKLQTFGMEKENLPTEVGGLIQCNLDDWLKQRQSQGK